jgi:hypothetical protein
MGCLAYLPRDLQRGTSHLRGGNGLLLETIGVYARARRQRFDAPLLAIAMGAGHLSAEEAYHLVSNRSCHSIKIHSVVRLRPLDIRRERSA